jgi:tetratricopeptide (TPR) repeat protein
MDRWRWTAKGPNAGDSPRTLSFRAACADYSWNDAPLGLNGEWNISFGRGRDHTSVWRLPHPVTLEAGAELRAQLRFNPSPDWSDQNLGRFRISVSSDPAVFDREQSRFAAMNLADPWSRLAAAYAVNRRNDEASRYFSQAIERADDYEARKPIVEVAAWSDEVLSALIKRQPDDPQLQLAFARKLAEHGKKRLAEKQPASAQAELEKSREMITRLREKAPETQWTVLKPTELKSERGTMLALQSDGSIMASGKNPDQDIYTLTAPIAGGPVGGLRLETIPDERLNEDAGFLNGAFFLTEIEAAVEARDGGTDRLLAIKNSFADFAHVDYPVSRAFDHDPTTSWVPWPRVSEPHTAVFEFQSLSAAQDGSQRLKVRLESGSHMYPQRNLRRFRLSVTNRPAGLVAAAQVRNDFNDSDVVDLNVALAKAHAQQGHTSEAVASFSEALTLAADRASKATIIAAAAPLEGVLEKLDKRASGDGLFQAELARHFAERGNAPLAAAAQTRARASFERQLEAKPSNTVLASTLADVLLPSIDAKTLVPTSENEGIAWRYSTEQPPDNWMRKEFDDSAWSSGPGGFGGAWPSRAVVRTPWTTKDIWLRRSFNWQPDPAAHALLLRIHHDEGFELFINGEPVYSLASYSTGYVFYPLDAKVLSVLKNGPNTMAVHCQQTTVGNQYIDVGINAVPSDPSALRHRLAAMRIAPDADPWEQLAAAYHAIGDQPAVDKLLKEHPAAVVGIGDLYAANQDWERAIAEYRKLVTDQPADVALLTKLAAAYQSAGRTREAVPLLATAYAANPKDTTLSLKVSALQVWFGQDNDFAATRRLILSSAKGTNEAGPANEAARACSIRPFTDKAEFEAALALGRTAVRAGNGGEWNLLALGMAEYRGGDYAAADKTLLAVAEAGPNNPQATCISAFYRAMNVCRQGKAEEARKLAVAATSKMKPLPKDEKNPLAGGLFADDLILWLAYKEAKALIQFDPPPAAPASPNGK